MATVLVVDDSAFMRSRCTQFIKQLGYDSVEAGDGDQAIATYKKSRPQLVLMDITMPGMDGLTAVKEIINFDPKAKLVMLTALNQKGIIVEVLKAGAIDFMTKPFEAEKFNEVVNKVIGTSGAGAALERKVG